ncbi:PQQ-binding-like beta-propeller repeat protein [Maribellus sp. YY47]|uniref:PQQ-binding-like beta-propeller repeat protein n=1 Tax=Maribellus sp. YY47 TaxID=2929486 RepID=UPI002001985F|nr:PQQ-binding-like beta-propeller repeat protein [Maribellus sp. YY47]MCK3683457.1 PQQ-like beta-propeller repeat protein [Maribellus sp. YY47]
MKKQHLILLRGSVSLIILIFILSSCSTNEWPQFRGAKSDMIVPGQNLPTDWSDSLNIRWTQAMDGESWSSPIVYDDKVFYSSAVLVKKAPEKPKSEDPAQQEADKNSLPEDVYRWQLTCLDANSGKKLWNVVSREGSPRIKKHAGSTYACETPVTDGKHVWVYYGMHGVYCYDLNGSLVWQQDPGAYPTLNDWGTGSSPVLYNNTLYVLVDNEENSFLIAYDAQTGNEKWKIDRDETTTYSTPVIWENSLRTELVTLGTKARSYNPETGELLWELEFNKGRAVASPVFDKEKIYVGLSGGPRDVGPLHAVKAGASGKLTPAYKSSNEFVAWSDTLAGLCNPSPVLYNGLLYLIADRNGEVTCIDPETGEHVYKEKAGKVAACWASPWICNNQLYFYDEKGVTNIIKPGREFEVLGSNSIDDKFWASIAVTKDSYIFKGVKNIYCIGK